MNIVVPLFSGGLPMSKRKLGRGEKSGSALISASVQHIALALFLQNVGAEKFLFARFAKRNFTESKAPLREREFVSVLNLAASRHMSCILLIAARHAQRNYAAK